MPFLMMSEEDFNELDAVEDESELVLEDDETYYDEDFLIFSDKEIQELQDELSLKTDFASRYRLSKLLRRKENDSYKYNRGRQILYSLAEEGFPHAQYEEGTEQFLYHPEEALEWWYKAAQKNHVESCVMLVQDYMTRQYRCKDYDEFVNYLRKTQRSDDVCCNVMLGQLLFEEGNIRDGLRLLDKGIQKSKTLFFNGYADYIRNVALRFNRHAAVLLSAITNFYNVFMELIDTEDDPLEWVHKYWIPDCIESSDVLKVLAQLKLMNKNRDIIQYIDRWNSHVSLTTEKDQAVYDECMLYAAKIFLYGTWDVKPDSKTARQYLDQMFSRTGEAEYLYGLSFVRTKNTSHSQAVNSFKSAAQLGSREAAYILGEMFCENEFGYKVTNPEKIREAKNLACRGGSVKYRVLDAIERKDEKRIAQILSGEYYFPTNKYHWADKTQYQVHYTNEEYLKYIRKTVLYKVSGGAEKANEYLDDLIRKTRKVNDCAASLRKHIKESENAFWNWKFLNNNIFAVNILESAVKDYQGTKRGYDGEKAVATYLSKNAPHWTVLRNIIVPRGISGDSLENDFILLTHFGIFTLEVKNYTDKNITITKEGIVLGRYGDDSADTTNHNLIAQMTMHETSLTAYLQKHFHDQSRHFEQYIHALSVFTDRSVTIKNETSLPVINLDLLYYTINAWNREEIFSDEDLDDFKCILEMAPASAKKYTFLDLPAYLWFQTEFEDYAEGIILAAKYLTNMK